MKRGGCYQSRFHWGSEAGPVDAPGELVWKNVAVLDGRRTDPSQSNPHGDCFVRLDSSRPSNTGAEGIVGTEGWRDEGGLDLLGSTNDHGVKMGRCNVGEEGFDVEQIYGGYLRSRRQSWSSEGGGWGRYCVWAKDPDRKMA